MYEIDEVQDFVDGGRKQLKISPRLNPVAVLGGTWKIFLDHGTKELTEMLLQGFLSGKEMGVFLYLVQEMGVGNTVNVSQKQLAERFGVTVSYVSKVLIALRRLDLIRLGMINPMIVTKCRTEDYLPIRAAWNKLGGEEQLPRAFGTPTKESVNA